MAQVRADRGGGYACSNIMSHLQAVLGRVEQLGVNESYGAYAYDHRRTPLWRCPAPHILLIDALRPSQIRFPPASPIPASGPRVHTPTISLRHPSYKPLSLSLLSLPSPSHPASTASHLHLRPPQVCTGIGPPQRSRTVHPVRAKAPSPPSLSHTLFFPTTPFPTPLSSAPILLCQYLPHEFLRYCGAALLSPARCTLPPRPIPSPSPPHTLSLHIPYPRPPHAIPSPISPLLQPPPQRCIWCSYFDIWPTALRPHSTGSYIGVTRNLCTVHSLPRLYRASPSTPISFFHPSPPLVPPAPHLLLPHFTDSWPMDSRPRSTVFHIPFFPSPHPSFHQLRTCCSRTNVCSTASHPHGASTLFTSAAACRMLLTWARGAGGASRIDGSRGSGGEHREEGGKGAKGRGESGGEGVLKKWGLKEGEVKEGEEKEGEVKEREEKEGEVNEGGLKVGGLKVGGLKVGGLKKGGLKKGGLKVGGLKKGGLKKGGLNQRGLKGRREREEGRGGL
ncbi:unnamed protein product [Closterium sp. NIES-65]|nr:unnamed protein product [Closterium sp. NIES-65]